MKKIFFYVLLLSFGFLKGQQSGNIQINWSQSNDVSYGDYKFIVPNFNAENFNFNQQNKSVLFIKKIQINAAVEESSLQISNLTFQDVNQNELGDLSLAAIPSSINATLTNSYAREEVTSVLVFSPIVKENGTFKKVISFNYSFSQSLGNKNALQNSVSSITNSVLSSGTFKRFYVQTSGVYKLSKAFLESIGFNTSGTDPRNIKIYGNGGRMVPLSNAISYPIDLAENAIQVIGENDGIFNNEDYILFYAEGTDNWSPTNKTHLNLYEDKSFYYVTTDGSSGKRIPLNAAITAPASMTTSIYDDYKFHEVDLTNIGKVGRIWYGEPFNTINEQQFNFDFSNINTTFPTDLSIHYGGNSIISTTFSTTVNNVNVGTVMLGTVTLNSGYEASDISLNASLTSATTFNVKINFNNGGVPTSKGYLDYIVLKAKSNLVGLGKQYRFRTNNAAMLSGVIDYQFTNASAIKQIWNISDIYNVERMPFVPATTISVKANLGVASEFIVIDESDYYNPLKETSTLVYNQNLKGTIFKNASGNFQDIDYLIVTPGFLSGSAERLANFHRSYSNLNVKVVTLDGIYAEFGGGKQDIGAIRNFVKYVYQNASTPSKRVKYLNLFGNASFDFKNKIGSINTNIVPIYHATYSNTSGEASFASDDFFALMDLNEGDIEALTPYGIDIAVGRMIVSSVQQADEMVNKVLEYHDIKSYGSWRNNYVAISDDPDNYKSEDTFLQFYQNRLTDIIYQEKPFLNFKKILIDSYQQETNSGGARYPLAKEDLRKSFEKGSLVVNYLGHGGESGLTNERVWDKPDGANFNNQFRYPLFITITCDFSKFDNPYVKTAGALTYWNPKGGAISMITTIRSIGQVSAQAFNDVLSSNLFSYGSDDYPSIAESLRLAKNASLNNSSTRVVFYLGDPALKLAIAKPNVTLTKVNDVPITSPIDDFKALSYVKLTGEVRDELGNLLTNYNGELAVTIFDKNYIRNTLRNDGVDAIIALPNVTATTMAFNNLGETIFRGNASVTNGLFEFGFVVPKDIKIGLGNGRISFYAKRNEILLDKSGYNTAIKVGGINLNAVADVTPPKLRLYMNDETFVNGGVTNQSPYFLAFLEDEHGINTASGIGHDIVGILDGNESNPYVMNDYYETELNNYQKGKIRFLFRNLSIGLHTIKFKAWDVYNNFVTQEIQFVVVGDGELSLTNVLNYPNPFVNYTQFWFSHNKPFEPLEVQVLIMTITGKVVKSINEIVTNSGFLSREIIWDGKDDFGDAIGKGVYIYKLTVRSTISDQKSEKIEKLVIL